MESNYKSVIKLNEYPLDQLVRVGNYELEKTIGSGNFAIVKLATHVITKSKVAIKIIDKTRLDEDNLKKTFREIAIMKKLRHPHVIRLYQVMESAHSLYLVTEYAGNGEIFDRLVSKGRMSEAEAARIFAQMVAAVGHCHSRSIVHRDLKAENLLLDEHMDIKLADFGFSNWSASGDRLGTWCGSPPYAAPELFQGLHYDGRKADVWSLGVVLYVCVCGALPFDGGTLSELRSCVLAGRFRIPYFMSQECEHLIRQMLVVEAEKRAPLSAVRLHKWLANYPHLVQTDISVGACSCHSTFSTEVEARTAERASSALGSLGVSSARVQQSLLEERYDNIYGMYHLIVEKFNRRDQSGEANDLMDDSIGEPLDLSRCTINDEEMMEPDYIVDSNIERWGGDGSAVTLDRDKTTPARRHTVPAAPQVPFDLQACKLGCMLTAGDSDSHHQRCWGLTPAWPPDSGKDQHLLKPPLAMQNQGASWSRRASDGGAYPQNRRNDTLQGAESAGNSSTALESEEQAADVAYNTTLNRYMVSRGCGKRHTMATTEDARNINHSSTSPSSSTRVRRTGLLTVTERPPGREHSDRTSNNRRASDSTPAAGNELRAARIEYSMLQRELERRSMPAHERTPSVSQPGSPCHAAASIADPAMHARTQSSRGWVGAGGGGGSITRGTPQPANNVLDLSQPIHRSLNNSPISNPGSPLDMIQEESVNNHFKPSLNPISPINPQISLTDCLGSEVTLVATDSGGSVDSLETNKYHIPNFVITEPTDLNLPSITKGIGRKVSDADQNMVEESIKDSLEFRRGSDKSLGFSDDSLSNDSANVSPNCEHNVQSIYSNIVSISSGFSENRSSFSEHRGSFSFSDRGSFSGEGTRNSFSFAETPRSSFSGQGEEFPRDSSKHDVRLERFDEESPTEEGDVHKSSMDLDKLQKSTMDLTLTDVSKYERIPIIQAHQTITTFNEYYEIALSNVFSKLDANSIVQVLKNAINTRVPPQKIETETDQSVQSDQECLTGFLNLEYSGGVQIELVVCERSKDIKGLKMRRISGDQLEYGKLCQQLISCLTV